MKIVKDLENKRLIDDILKIEELTFKKEKYSKDQLEKMILDDGYILVVNGEEELKGYLLLHDSFDLYEIMKICVIDKYRGLDIGKELIYYYLENYNKNLFLEVRESNMRAIGFYEKLNFTKVGKRKNYYSDGENAILMMLERN